MLQAVAGDVTDPRHRDALAAAVDTFGRLDLLVNNAGELGPSPLPALDSYPLASLRTLLETNLVAPLALTQVLLPALRDSSAAVVNISSDPAVEGYEGWGGYGASKAALDQLSAVLAAERRTGSIAMLLIEQNVDFAMRTADRFALLDRGEISDSGRTDAPDAHARILRELAV